MEWHEQSREIQLWSFIVKDIVSWFYRFLVTHTQHFVHHFQYFHPIGNRLCERIAVRKCIPLYIMHGHLNDNEWDLLINRHVLKNWRGGKERKKKKKKKLCIGECLEVHWGIWGQCIEILQCNTWRAFLVWRQSALFFHLRDILKYIVFGIMALGLHVEILTLMLWVTRCRLYCLPHFHSNTLLLSCFPFMFACFRLVSLALSR